MKKCPDAPYQDAYLLMFAKGNNQETKYILSQRAVDFSRNSCDELYKPQQQAAEVECQ